MKLFRNIQFIIHSEFPYWSKLGFKTKSKDNRIINIKPLHITQPTEKVKQTLLMSAEIKLKDSPKITSKNEIMIPKEESDELSSMLKISSNLISVANNCKVGLSGPTPSIGFIYETEDEKKFLDSTNGFDTTLGVGINFSGIFFEEIYQDQLLDRIEGVAFLATANSQTDNVAQFHEYIRLFERAFASSTAKLANLLHEFISSVKGLDYTFEEIKDWMVDTRHGATHADSRDNFVFSLDLNKDIERIKQLAYFVLFNKKSWHNQNTERRKLLLLKQGVLRNGLFMTRNNTDDEKKILKIEDDDDIFYASSISEDDLNAQEFKDPDNWWVRWLPPNNYGKN
jgi:hypothetical protein